MIDSGAVVKCSRTLPKCILLLSVFAAAAASCTPGQAVLSRKAHLAREELVGTPREDMLRCAGEPARIQQQGSREYWSYISGEPQIGSDHTRCVVTVRLQRGYVDSIDYENPNGNLIGRSLPECLDVVGPCLPETPEED